MKGYPLLVAAFLLSICAAAQDECTQGFAKLLPDPTVDYSLDFGYSVSVHENFMAVGVPNSDTLSRESGIVYIYEKRVGTWVRIASMVSSEPVPDLQLGISVKLTENYLFASASAGGGSVHVYRKPPSGWSTASQMTIITVEGTQSFGVAYHHPVDLSEDENTLVITDAMKPHNNNPISIAGSIFVFHKDAGNEWTNDLTPVEIKATTDVIDLGRNGTYIRGNRIFTGTPFTSSGSGNIFVYHDPGGTFDNLTLEATLSAVPGAGFWMDNMVVTNAGLFVSGTTPDAGIKILFYPKPFDESWTDASPTCVIDPDGNPQTSHWNFLRLGATSTSLYAIFPGPAGISLTKLTEGTTGWCNPSVEIIETRTTSRYGSLIQVGEYDDVIVGFVGHPWKEISFTALNAYSKGNGNAWTSTRLYSTAESTRGHGYGHALAIHDDLIFVGAPYDNSIKEYGGKVYVYRQQGPDLPWVKINVIDPPIGLLSDSEFGSAIATNGEYLAVGARSWQPSRILIYRKGTSGWANPEFSQAIEVPVGELSQATYGESVVMDDRWLLIPFVDQRGFSGVSVAVYELVDGVWTYRQSLSTGYAGLFTGTPNGGVAISGGIIVAADRLYELTEEGLWQHTCTLSPSDPERLRFNFPRFELISNGSNFGRSVAIHENAIAIGAPRQDAFVNGTVWDVGAVYVFTKRPDEKWTDRRETVKIVPNEINASSLFGWDVSFAEHALIIGAPTSPTFAKPDPNQSPKNNARGKVYMYQPDDPSWKRLSLMKTFEGQSTFRDNFGVKIAYSSGKIFIGSSEEDIATGRTSGSVYITDAPTLLTPVGPLCADGGPITLRSSQAGGVWSGIGIVDELTGEFNPSVAGPGIHQITYVNGICQRSGKINLSVSPPVHAQISGPAEVLMCATQVYFSRTLSAVSVPDVKYEWHYRPDAGAEFVPLPEHTSRQAIVSQRGDYQVRLYNEGCEGYSETLSIRDESVEISIDPPGEVCGTPPGGIPLTATPAGGIWLGPGVTENKFSIENLSDGDYVVDYLYTSALGCKYPAQATIAVKRLPAPSVRRDGHLCKTSLVSLSMVSETLEGAAYTWSHQPLEGGSFVEVGSGANYEATTWGRYQLKVTKGDCQATSVPLHVTDSFSALLSPAEERAELCHDHGLRLSYPDDGTSSYEWYYSPDGQTTTLLPENANSIRPDRTGYYKGTVYRGVCSVTGPTKFFYVHHKDSVFVPNVFTPNGDGKNDSFAFIIFHQDEDPADGDAQDDVRYEIYNRYGRKIFTAPQNQPWTGANSEGGVYFWLGMYHSCQGDARTIKGTVHLVK